MNLESWRYIARARLHAPNEIRIRPAENLHARPDIPYHSRARGIRADVIARHAIARHASPRRVRAVDGDTLIQVTGDDIARASK